MQPPRLTIETAMGTDRGVVREHNEDAVGGDPSKGLLILADGMGGANAGEVASELAIDMLISQLVGESQKPTIPFGNEDLLTVLRSVNQAILEISQQVPEYRGMGTTLVVGLFRDRLLTYAHVGDSRLYRLRDRVLERLTTDHTLIQEIVNAGEFASLEEAVLAGVPQNVLTRAFGVEPEVAVDLAETDLQAGDLYLFCSDGLTGMVTDQAMQSILEDPNRDLMGMIDELIDQACSSGGLDNISVILVRVVESEHK